MLKTSPCTSPSPLAPIDFSSELIPPSPSLVSERRRVQVEEPDYAPFSPSRSADDSSAVAKTERLKKLLPSLRPMGMPELDRYGVDRAISEGHKVLTRLGWMPGTGKVFALAAEDEVALFRALSASIARAGSLIRGLEAAAEPRDLQDAVEALDTGVRFKSALVESNMPLVLAMAKHAKLAGVDFDEMISEGNLVLLHSVERFDWSRGYKFSTYACCAILRSFSRVALRTSKRHTQFVQEKTEISPIDEEHNPVSEAIQREGDFTSREFLRAGLEALEPAEKRVLIRRFNLDGRGRKTLKEVGKELGLSKERIRQIEQGALGRLRDLADKDWADKL